MKKHLLCLAVALITMTTASFAQDNGYTLPRLVSSEIDRAGNELRISYVLDYSQMTLRTNQAVIVTPIIVGLSDTAELAPVIFAGNTKRKMIERNSGDNAPYRLVLMTATNRPNRARNNEVLDIAQGNSSDVLTYAQTIPYEPWMEGATVVLQEDYIPCHTVTDEYFVNIGQISQPAVPAMVMFITPEYETVNFQREEMTAYINFQQGKYNILPGMDQNRAELDGMVNFAQKILNNKDVNVKGIYMKGYASPEGSYAFNTKLAENRVDALRSYMQDKLGSRGTDIQVSTGPIDWDSLRHWVAESNLSNKSEILGILDNTKDPVARNNKLKALGSTYTMLLDKVYPSLRRVDFAIDYQPKPVTVETVQATLMEAPANLSLNDIYMLAASYPAQAAEAAEVYAVASQYYPDDAVICNNMAAHAMKKGDIATAKKQLQRAASDPQCQNNLGILAAIEGNYAEAENHFRKAIQAGSKEARYNMAHLRELVLEAE